MNKQNETQSKDTNSETIKEPNPEALEINTGGLGMNPGYSAVTSTYKRAEKRRRKKFDEWWKSSHGS